MGSSKRTASAATTAKERHRKAQRMLLGPKAPLPAGLVAKPIIPKLKHHTYFEIMENKDKKKKLEFQITTDKKPPPGFEFVPMGNPALTTACKELSREKDAMIFIVSSLNDAPVASLGHQVHRIGHHIRESIVEEARSQVDVLPIESSVPVGEPEPIPTSQMQYNAQVDAAIRDLFPRIPNTDRQIIVEHAFDLSAAGRKGEKPVGLSADITLARRVQLAVLAHIRHTHTLYDDLRKKTTWTNARRAVEPLCLDILVKWRGDEETGRDQLDEILQEVVVISDSEDSEDDDADVSSSESDSSVEVISPPCRSAAAPQEPDHRVSGHSSQHTYQHHVSPRLSSDALTPKASRAPGKKEQRGFKRYRAWQKAIQRSRAGEGPSDAQMMHKSISQGIHPQLVSGPLSLAENRHHVPESRFGLAAALPSRAPEATSTGTFPGSCPLLYDTIPLEHTSQRPSLGAPIQRPISPPIQDRFKDLLVQSIEPASPDVMQPSFVRTIPSKSPEPRRYIPQYEEHFRGGPHPGTTLGTSYASPQAPSYWRAPVLPQHQADFPGGFIQVSGRVAPEMYQSRPQEFPPAVSDASGEPLLVQSRVRQREPDPLTDFPPAKRSLLEPSPLIRPPDRFYMGDRGGFLEKVPINLEGSRPPLVDPGFIELRRSRDSRFGTDRVVSFEEGRRLREEPGVEIIPISSSARPSTKASPAGAPPSMYHSLDPLSANSYLETPKEVLPMHQSRQQKVFRYVRGNEPVAPYFPSQRPNEEYTPPSHGRRQVSYLAPWEVEHPVPRHVYEADNPTHGRNSHTPVILD